jgi:hypothetical protein
MNLEIKKEDKNFISKEASIFTDSLFSASLLVGEQLTVQIKNPN